MNPFSNAVLVGCCSLTYREFGNARIITQQDGNVKGDDNPRDHTGPSAW
jgi:hypothetical protein